MCCILCDFQPTPRSTSTILELGGGAVYQPLQYSSAAPPAEPAGFLSHYTQPTSPVYPGPPPISQCPSSSSPSYPPFYPTSSSSSFAAPPTSGASFQHGGPGSPVSYMPPPPPLQQGGVSGTQLTPPQVCRAPGHLTNSPTFFTLLRYKTDFSLCSIIAVNKAAKRLPLPMLGQTFLKKSCKENLNLI